MKNKLPAVLTCALIALALSVTALVLVLALPNEKGGVGDKGDAGDQGKAEKSAYEIAVEYGYVGSESQWLAALTGASGADGKDGAAWHTGDGAPVAALGNAGDYYVNLADGKIFNKTDTDEWAFIADTALGNPFKNMIYTAIGDSITDAEGWWTDKSTSSVYVNADGWDTGYVPRVKDILGFKTANNLGSAGATFVTWAASGSLTNSTVMASDVITVMLGVNDFGKDTPLGAYADRKNNASTLYGAVYTVLDRLTTSCPTSTIIMITPLPTNVTGAGFSGDDWKKANSLGYTLEDVVNVIIRLSNDFSVPVLDLYRMSGMNQNNHTNYYLNDQLHLNTGGYEKVSPIIAQYIKSPATSPSVIVG